MAEYQISERTKSRLVEAAGELFAEHGFDRVTTREIAAKAGTVQNAIRYHFGGIDGLIEAVWNFVLKEWVPDRFARLIRANEKLLDSDEGKIKLVTKCISLIFRIIYQEKRPLWISKFLVRCALSAEGRETIAARVSGSIVPVMIRLHAKITGTDDPEAAQCWVLRIAAAPMVLTGDLTEYIRFREGTSINRKLYKELEEATIRDALFAVGLSSGITGTGV